MKLAWPKIFLILTLIVSPTSFAKAAFGPSLVFDANTGEVLVADRAGVPWHPASLTKLMTAYVTFQALQSGRITLQTKLLVSKHAASRPPSKIGVKAGSRVTVDFALKALLIHSANDMAATLAENLGGSIAGFSAKMNAQARRLGMTGTNYVNPHGLHDKRQITTARDLGILATTILLEFPQYSRYFSAHSMKVGKRTIKSRNKLATKYDWVDGMKTGYLCTSGYNLVTSATVNGRRLISVSLGARSGKGRNEFSRVLLEWSGNSASRSSLRLAHIHNLKGTPKNLRSVVCKRPQRILWGSLKELNGWGVSLGQYKSAYTADAVLAARVLISRRFLSAGKLGVYRSLEPRKYVAMLSQMRQKESLTLCSYLRRSNAYCEVLTPQSMAAFEQQREQAKLAKGKRAKRSKNKRKRKLIAR